MVKNVFISLEGRGAWIRQRSLSNHLDMAGLVLQRGALAALAPRSFAFGELLPRRLRRARY